MKQTNKVQGFTLVELIVVITILAILGTIAFISLQGYSAQARDSKKISDINNIKTSLELFSLNTGSYPLPDSGTGVLHDTEIVWTQGIVGDNVITNLSRNFNEKPIDPLTETEYTYSVANGRSQYELLSNYESDLFSFNNNLLNQINAANQTYPKIDGTYNGIFVKTPTYYIPLPSIITSADLSTGLTLVDGTVADQIITGGDNNIAYGQEPAQTNGLPNFTISSFSGTISDKNDDNKELLAQVLIDAYSGTLLAKEGIYKIIAKTDPTNFIDLISLVDDIILSSGAYTSSGGGDDTPIVTDWRSVDDKCNLPDVQIGTQYWAGCNSTLGTGIEYTDESYCYNYDKDGDGTNNNLGDGDIDIIGESGTCGVGNYGDSNDNAKNYYDSLAGEGNQNGDTELDNIWGKLYTWDSMDTDNDNDIDKNDTNLVCGSGYHVPTDAEWDYAENYLYGSVCAGPNIDRNENGTSDGNGRGCDGLGWNSLNGNKERKLVNLLKIPLAGNLSTNGITFGNRGFLAYLWSSTPSNNDAYMRYFYLINSTTARNNYSKSYGFSVRCIKDQPDL